MIATDVGDVKEFWIGHHESKFPPKMIDVVQGIEATEIWFQGYTPGGVTAGSCVAIEIGDDGHPRILVWADRNDESPTHLISLAGAADPV